MMWADLNKLRQRLQALGYLFAAVDNEAAAELEWAALDLALNRALTFAEQFCNRPLKMELKAETAAAEEPPAGFLAKQQCAAPPLESGGDCSAAVLDLAAAYFLQSRLALAPDSLAVTPSLTSLRLGDAAWGFGGGSRKSGVDEKTRAENLAADLMRSAKAALCDWRSIY